MIDPTQAKGTIEVAEKLASSQFSLLLFTWLILAIAAWAVYKLWQSRDALLNERINQLTTQVSACQTSHADCRQQNAALVQTMQKMLEGKSLEVRGALAAMATTLGVPPTQ